MPSAKVLGLLNNTARVEYTAADPEQHQHLQRSSIPPPVLATYEQCDAPPSLHLLDACTDDGKSCLSKYTNPEFFIEKWIEEQQKQVEIMKAERKKRREEKRLAMKNEGEGTGGAKPIKKLRKVRYDPETGKKIIEEEDAEESAPNTTTAASPNTARPSASQPSSATSTLAENHHAEPSHEKDHASSKSKSSSGKSSSKSKDKDSGSSKSKTSKSSSKTKTSEPHHVRVENTPPLSQNSLLS